MQASFYISAGWKIIASHWTPLAYTYCFVYLFTLPYSLKAGIENPSFSGIFFSLHMRCSSFPLSTPAIVSRAFIERISLFANLLMLVHLFTRSSRMTPVVFFFSLKKKKKCASSFGGVKLSQASVLRRTVKWQRQKSNASQTRRAPWCYLVAHLRSKKQRNSHWNGKTSFSWRLRRKEQKNEPVSNKVIVFTFRPPPGEPFGALPKRKARPL